MISVFSTWDIVKPVFSLLYFVFRVSLWSCLPCNSLCRPYCPQAHQDFPPSASGVLDLMVCTTIANFSLSFKHRCILCMCVCIYVCVHRFQRRHQTSGSYRWLRGAQHECWFSLRTTGTLNCYAISPVSCLLYSGMQNLLFLSLFSEANHTFPELWVWSILFVLAHTIPFLHHRVLVTIMAVFFFCIFFLQTETKVCGFI